MSQARQQSIIVPFIGGNGFNTPKIIELVKEADEGLIVAIPWFIGNENEKAQNFIKNFKNEYGNLPDQFAAQAYDAIYLIAEAVKTADLNNPVEIRDSLSAISNFNGILGDFSFDGHGEVVMRPLVLTVKDGEFQIFD